MATPLPRNAIFLPDASELQRIVGGVVVQSGAPEILSTRSVCTDSREVQRGDVFVALVGEKHDAHAFVHDVVARGAGLLVVSRDVTVPNSVGVVRVPDTLVALGRLGRWQREPHVVRTPRLDAVIAITGSVGKTSTKEMCAAVLRAIDLRVVATEGNLNNLIGVPRTLLMIDEQTRYAVVEMGMNVPGEIAKLCAIAEPDIGIVTNVAPVHTEGVGSIDGVAREKGALLTSLPESGTAIYDGDEPLLIPSANASKASRKLAFGESQDADVRMTFRTPAREGQTVGYRVRGRDGEDVVLDLALLGHGAAKNAGAALALGWAIGGEKGVDAAKRGLALLRPEPGRLCPLHGPGGTVILDDSYNASPRSVINAIDTATEIARATSGRIVAVLGDMLELGALETEMHALIGEHVALAGVSMFVACGRRMRVAADEAREMGADFVLEVDDPLDAVREVERFLIEGDVVVIKGSRGMRMERVVEALRERKEAA
jgi:UDP-N-acetylmuramoyl-tripeptide--D-alanyl-D-alanine ligase